MGHRRALCFGLSLTLIGCGTARAEVQVVEQQRRYLLDASTLVELAGQLTRYRASSSDSDAKRSHGLTKVGIEARYELEPRADGRCALRQLRVLVHIVQTLPEWKPARPPQPTMSERVARMLHGLAEHERGHRNHVMVSAASIERRLAKLPEAEDCERARRNAERVVARELIRLRTREFNYDIATDGGRKQGALLEVEREAPRRRARLTAPGSRP